MILVNYKMAVMNTILFGLVFGIGLYLSCDSLKTPDISRECTIERYKVNNTDKVYGLYMYFTSVDDKFCYNGWYEIAMASTYREISHVFDRLVETHPVGSKIICYKEDINLMTPNFLQFIAGLIMIIGSLFTVVSPAR